MITLKSDVLVISGRKYKTTASCMKTASIGDKILISKEMTKPYHGSYGLNASKYILENLTKNEKHIVTETVLINTINSFIFE